MCIHYFGGRNRYKATTILIFLLQVHHSAFFPFLRLRPFKKGVISNSYCSYCLTPRPPYFFFFLQSPHKPNPLNLFLSLLMSEKACQRQEISFYKVSYTCWSPESFNSPFLHPSRKQMQYPVTTCQYLYSQSPDIMLKVHYLLWQRRGGNKNCSTQGKERTRVKDLPKIYKN